MRTLFYILYPIYDYKVRRYKKLTKYELEAQTKIDFYRK